MTPPAAEAGMPVVFTEPLRGAAAPEPAISAVTPEGVALAAVAEVPAAAVMAKAALAVMALLINVAREPV